MPSATSHSAKPTTKAAPTTTTTSTTQPTATPALTLPSPIYARLAPHSYIHHSLTSPPHSRPTTHPPRLPSQHRQPHFHNPTLPHCAGSSVLRLGATAITIGITHSILPASTIPDPPPASVNEAEKIARLSLLVPNVELAGGCSPRFSASGGARGDETQVLSVRLLQLLVTTNLVQLENLTIRRGVRAASPLPGLGDIDDENRERWKDVVGYHVLHIHVLILSLDGLDSLIDAAWGAVYAALRNTRLPSSWWDDELISPTSAGGQGLGGVVCSPLVEDMTRLRLKGRPVACTWGIFSPSAAQTSLSIASTGDAGADSEAGEHEGPGNVITSKTGQKSWLLADPDDFESQLCSESITLAVDCSDETPKILAVQKSGGAVVGREQMRVLVEAARRRWQEWDGVLG